MMLKSKNPWSTFSLSIMAVLTNSDIAVDIGGASPGYPGSQLSIAKAGETRCDAGNLASMLYNLFLPRRDHISLNVCPLESLLA
jgi:hypothetical protein